MFLLVVQYFGPSDLKNIIGLEKNLMFYNQNCKFQGNFGLIPALFRYIVVLIANLTNLGLLRI